MDRASSPPIKAERLDTPHLIIHRDSSPPVKTERLDTPPLRVKLENPEAEGLAIPLPPTHPEDPGVTATANADINASLKRCHEDSPTPSRPPVSYPSFSLERPTSNCVVSQQGAGVNPIFKGLLPVVISLEDKGHSENWGKDPLGFARLEDWSPQKIIFTFGVLGIDAHLSPQFDTRQLEKGVKKVHTTLTFYGHTVMTDTNIGTEHEAKAEACLRALRKLQNQHHWWNVPPMPTGQAVESESDWKKLLADYCAEHEKCQPVYGPLAEAAAGWHCDVAVKHRVFCTAATASNRQQAQSTAAHAVLYQLLVGDDRPSQGWSSRGKVKTEGRARSPAPRYQPQRGVPVWRSWANSDAWWRRKRHNQKRPKEEPEEDFASSPYEVRIKAEPRLSPPPFLSPPPPRKKKKESAGSPARAREGKKEGGNPNLTPMGKPRFDFWVKRESGVERRQ